MVYLFGAIGFVFGFAIGVGLINVILMRVPKDQLQKDKSLRWKYGTLVWVISALGTWAGVTIHSHFF